MRPANRGRKRLIPLTLAVSLAGCAGAPPTASPPHPILASESTDAPTIQQIVHVESMLPDSSADEAPFAGAAELSLQSLVDEVLKRNPSLVEMTAAWQAAQARYPQVTSLEDPMAGVLLGPGSIGSDMVDFGYRLDFSQKLPFPGKLRLKGEAASAEASAALHDVDEMRLNLIESAQNAYYEYYLVDRANAVNNENLRLLREFRENAETRYRTALAPQQDVLQADVEIGRLQERELTLQRMKQVSIARLNTLMHRSPTSPLPTAPAEVGKPSELPEAATLRDRAIAGRPELQAIANRIEADRASVALMAKEFYPDFNVMAAYDAFWQEHPLRPMVGVNLNVPVRKASKRAAVAEAAAKLAQRQAALARLTDQVNLEVQERYEQIVESQKSVRLYEETILPAAEENIKAAQTAYMTGKIPFLSLLSAERDLVALKDRYYETIRDYFVRKASLERAVGGPMAGDIAEQEIEKDGEQESLGPSLPR